MADAAPADSITKSQIHTQSRSNITPLWTQLLQKNPPALTLGASVKPLPPIAPIDKAGTSIRILLHDTQAQFEKFSERVVKLTDGVEGAKREVSTMQKLFEREHESLLQELVDLANRCQTQIQKSVGNPAQTSRVDELFQKVSTMDGKLAALDTKVDLLHMLNQTQTQALQTLQNQQGQLLAALTPVLPLLQAIPLHIDNAKHDVKDAIAQSQRASSADLQTFLSETTTHLRRNPSSNSSVSSDLPSSSLPARDLPLSSSPSDRPFKNLKRRRMDSPGGPGENDQSGRSVRRVYPSPRASASDSQLRSNAATRTPKATSRAAPSTLGFSHDKVSSTEPVLDLAAEAVTVYTTLVSTPKTCRGQLSAQHISPDRTPRPTSARQSTPACQNTPVTSSPGIHLSSASATAASVFSLHDNYRSLVPALTSPPRPRLSPRQNAENTPPKNQNRHHASSPVRVLPSKPFSLKDVRVSVGHAKRFIPIDDMDDDDSSSN
ncbi:hypothetical protein EUX98_g6389 [Antrodiella citrinella]|uniref:Uncharacterized protein n=1 Tax=Antrodiella citrinella TaxID=2447956 RepID=A0A4S4MPD4_9APHY|nr:hypothetical protein EUX98_g6389 [Antrodiella citrinella]